MIDEILVAIEKLLGSRSAGVLATIVRQAGPSPRGIGTKCLIRHDGSFVGSVGGGLLEARTLKRAREVFKTQLPVRLSFSLKGTDVAETEMLCGGEVELFLEPVPVGHPSLVAVFRSMTEDLQGGQGGVLITVMDPRHWEGGGVPKLFLRSSGEVVGSLPRGRAITEALSRDQKKIKGLRHLSVREMTDDQGEGVDVLIEPVTAPSILYVFGGGHVSRQIVPLAARVGFKTVVIDDREDFADAAFFPDAAEVHCLPFDGAVGRMPVERGAFIVIVTRGHLGDKVVLGQALRTRARYIGMIGSKQKRKQIYQALLEEGFTEEDLARVHSPIGLEIGAETPEEIAVSIVAELIQVRAGVEKP